jgi:serine/threonine protein kinase
MSQIGRYEVESELGRGAMGVVYLARDPRLERRVAVKTHALPRGLGEAQQREYRARFLREAHAAARLSHAGIVTIYDADEDPDDGTPFIAMEYVAGRSLREEFDRVGRIEVERATAMAGAVAEALHAAHDEGIVHRDVKPANLLIRDADGAIKVADFGVARVTTSELTQSGTSLGTPAYMSPEQIEGRTVDGRSDLFSLAVILYEALCGERPFDGDSIPAVIYSVARETPIPISKRAPGVPRGLDEFFDRALAKDAKNRFADGKSFKKGLESACRDESPLKLRETTRVAQVEPAEPAHLPAPVVTTPPPRRQEWPSESYLPGTIMLDSEEAPWWRRRHAIFVAATIILVIGLWALVGGTGSARFELEAKSSIEKGKLTILVDGDKVYSRRLSSKKTPKGLLKKLIDPKSETFDTTIKVAPGMHEVTASVLPEGASDPYQDSVMVAIESGETRRLKLTAGRPLGSTVSLRVN